MSTIDGNEIKNVTIDGAEVSSITMDGVTVWQKLVDAGVLRNIEVGDDLSGKTLYIGFSDNLYTMLDNYGGVGNVIKTVDNELDITSDVDSGIYEVDCYDTTQFTNLYYYDNGNLTDNINSYTVETSSNKIVTYINTSHPAYQYIKIINDGLRNVRVGDNLKNKTLFFDRFPYDGFDLITSAEDIITFGTQGKIESYIGTTTIEENTYDVKAVNLVNEDLSTSSITSGLSSNKFMNLFIQYYFFSSTEDLIVNSINKNNPYYEYIFIYDDISYQCIEVGDNLSGAKLYMAFPEDAYKFISINSTFVTSDAGSCISYSFDDEYGDAMVKIWENDLDDESLLYFNYTGLNLKEYQLSPLFGTVTNIVSNISAYRYIFIKPTPILTPDAACTRIAEWYPLSFYGKNPDKYTLQEGVMDGGKEYIFMISRNSDAVTFWGYIDKQKGTITVSTY